MTSDIPSEFAEKRGGTLDKECTCPIKGQCKQKQNLVLEDTNIEFLDNDYINLESFLEENNLKEVLELDYDYDFVDLTQLYHTLVSEQDIEKLISKLEKLEITGENPSKYWEKDKLFCILDIINPEYKIRTAKIEATNDNKEDFKMHINELLNLGVIQRSESPHR